ncbi:mechanosensitive ion channel family protein [Seohaeicola saemankumensis]|nr:mechanosensitive ion channel family protein [Seohaeicola saemankumensis]MCA0869982.1 mechanosensitive ion channel family protein [Seohaeicola saemankumensis]
MESDASQFHEFAARVSAGFNSWITVLADENLVWWLIFIFAAFVLRKSIATACLWTTSKLLGKFQVGLSEDVARQLKTAAEILVVTLAVFIASDVVIPEGVVTVFLDRILASIAIVAIFGAWFQLSGPFAALLRNDASNLVTSETDWIKRITQFAILLFGLTSLFKVWQIDISGALTGVGVLGAGLAIATQDLIRNLVAGMTNISEKRFETGDAIQVEGQFVGTVRRIDLRSTLVVGFDQIPRHIPNSNLSNSVVLNYSARKHRRIMLKVPLVLSSTRAQIEMVRDGLRDYHKTSGDFAIDDDAPDYIYVSELGPSSVDILIYVWTAGPDFEEALAVQERLTLAILKITEQAGTALAYPTQTLKVDPSVITEAFTATD